MPCVRVKHRKRVRFAEKLGWYRGVLLRPLRYYRGTKLFLLSKNVGSSVFDRSEQLAYCGLFFKKIKNRRKDNDENQRRNQRSNSRN